MMNYDNYKYGGINMLFSEYRKKQILNFFDINYNIDDNVDCETIDSSSKINDELKIRLNNMKNLIDHLEKSLKNNQFTEKELIVVCKKYDEVKKQYIALLEKYVFGG